MRAFKKVIRICLMLALLVPAANGLFHFWADPPLDGAVKYNPDVSFTLKDWWDGTWQEAKEKYLSEQYGGRNFIIRLRHELDFRLFKISHAKSVVVGKENYLYESDYIKTYFGGDFLGEQRVAEYMDKIKKSQDILTSYGKTQLFVLASGKGSFYPEYFPDEFDKNVKKQTNYETVIRMAKERGINFIDFSTYFRAIKDTSTYLLYPKYGIHWSMYGMSLVQDSIVRYIEGSRQIKMKHLKVKRYDLRSAEDMDYDIGYGLNLLSSLKGPLMAYPQFYTDAGNVTASPSLLVISDSFYWGIYRMGFSSLFSRSDFWYYYNEVYPDMFAANVHVKDLNFESEIMNHDVFLLMATEHNSPGVGWGFQDDVIGRIPVKPIDHP